jgi:hypothetical protein
MTSIEGRIGFSVCRPGTLVARVSARRDDPCRVILKVFPQLMLTCIYRGEILDLDATLGSYGITDGDLVVAVPTSNSSISDTNRWQNITRRSEAFEASVRSFLNLSTRSESMRLRDLAWYRVESTPRQFKRTVARFQRSQRVEVNRVQEPSVIPESPLEPSTAPLDVYWN